jgi:hypothetical protein
MSALPTQWEITPQIPDWLAGAPGFEPGNGRIKSPETAQSSPNQRKCRRFPDNGKSHRRYRTGWLGREDSNLGIAGVAHMLTATTTADSQAHYALAPDLVAAPRQPPPIQPWHSTAFHAASVITTWMTSIIRPPAFTVSGSAVASPSRTRSASLCRSRV